MLQIGDAVKILPKNDSQTYFPTYVHSMQKYAGRIATITDISKQSCKIDLDNGLYFWPFNALQLVNLEMNETVDPHNLKNGDYIKITNNFSNNISYIYLFKEVKDNKICRHAAYSLNTKLLSIDPYKRWNLAGTTRVTRVTYATEEERKLLNNALLEQGYKWNNLTKQLDSIGLIDIRTNNLPDKYDMYIDTLDCTKEKPQTETELNLFPTKKHYQLNFNY